ncbi:MAG: FHA domain-containing protein [Bdellovibrionales bacterium]|nr:FHA domain-containing protein [Bdellovibrionales bacterium]
MNSSRSYPELPDQKPVLRILRGSHKGKQFRLLGKQIVIGTQNDCDVILKGNKKCSSRHACIEPSQGYYIIRTLDSSNPVLINNKPVDKHILSSGDQIVIGDMLFQFKEKAPVSSSNRSQNFQKRKKRKKSSSISRFLLGGLMILLVALFLMPEDKKEAEDKSISVRTERDIENEVEALQKISEEEQKASTLPPEELEARVAFIKGFRDYRKGYYDRALKAFKHCVTLNKDYEICRSYVRQAQTQVNRIIQKKMLLGKNYQQNKQYGACKATFQSVEIMIQNSSNPIYKEALENRKLCELKTRNKL